jgi:hypothetical protein
MCEVDDATDGGSDGARTRLLQLVLLIAHQERHRIYNSAAVVVPADADSKVLNAVDYLVNKQPLVACEVSTRIVGNGFCCSCLESLSQS